MIPFIIFQIFFISYFNYTSPKYEQIKDETSADYKTEIVVVLMLKIIQKVIICLFAVYFSYHEVR
jgi:hypothetical protein